MNRARSYRSETDERRVGPYRLLARIGEGGMGVVHLAQAPDGSRVAVKVLRPHIIGDDEARERLAREVVSLRRVSSPRVAEVLDADPWGDTPYVATRYVPGPSLHEHVRQQGPVTGANLRWFAAGLAEALIAVHVVGVLHRDVKPSNVLLEGRSPVLIDFGLARLADDPRLTSAGWLLGTPGYLAPEVLYGEDATTASDVHAWAATVAFAALGRPPFGTGPAMAIMDRVRRGEHDLRGLPVDLLPVITRCLAAEPEDRPSTGEVLAATQALAVRHRRRTAAPAEPERLVAEDSTVPLVLAPPGPGQWSAPTVTRPLTVPLHRTATLEAPARGPHQQPQPPPPPRTGDRPPALLPPRTGRGATRPARTQGRLLLAGVLGAYVTGFAAAPYLAFMVLAVVVLLVRTLSWTTGSAWERQHLRGRRRWYDAPLTLLTTPWYLVVATGGSIVLLAWAAAVTLLCALGWLLLGLPRSPILPVAGAVLALALWWGPGGGRLRGASHRLVRGTVRVQWIGWVAVAAVAVGVALLAAQVSTGEVVWDPMPGPPWRPGTTLGSLLRWL